MARCLRPCLAQGARAMSARHPRRAITGSLARRALLAMSSLFVVGRARAQTAAPAAEREGFVMPPGRAPRYAGPQGRERDFTELLATSEQTGGGFCLVRQTIAPGRGPPAHLHPAADEFRTEEHTSERQSRQ